MAESRHTNGPWRTDENGSIVCYPEGLAVGVLSRQLPDAERQANHNLIIAAPELLDALKMFRDACDDAMLVEDDHVHVSFRESLLTALQVISKAEGK